MLIIHVIQALFALWLKADLIRLWHVRRASQQTLLQGSPAESVVSMAVPKQFYASLPSKFISGRCTAFLFTVPPSCLYLKDSL